MGKRDFSDKIRFCIIFAAEKINDCKAGRVQCHCKEEYQSFRPG